MGELVPFKNKDRCWRCGFKSIYHVEDEKGLFGLCATCGDSEFRRALSGDPGIIWKFFVPIGNGEYRRFAECNFSDINRFQDYLNTTAAKDLEDAKTSEGLLKEARRLGIKRDQAVIPFLSEAARKGIISPEGRKCLEYVLANWDPNELWLAAPEQKSKPAK